MNTHVDGFHLRVERAAQHIADFDLSSQEYFDSSPYQVVTERESRTQDDFLRITLQINTLTPRNLGFIFADCIHNLRSVADNVIWQLGHNYGTSEGISFPVTTHPNDFRSRLDDGVNQLSLLPSDALNIVEELQPYHRENPQDHPLWILNRLWNNDKHRTPAVVATISNDTVLDAQAGGVGHWSGPMPLYHDAYLMGVSIPKGAEVAPQLQFDHEIILEGEVAGGVNASALLVGLHDFVRDEIVAKFVPFF